MKSLKNRQFFYKVLSVPKKAEILHLAPSISRVTKELLPRLESVKKPGVAGFPQVEKALKNAISEVPSDLFQSLMESMHLAKPPSGLY